MSESLHILDEIVLENKEYRCTCSCGAMWTHPAARSFEERLATFEAHVAYFRHKKMETL